MTAPAVTSRVIGAERVVAKLGTENPAIIRERVRREVALLGYTLERRVKLDKLMGQVLHRRTGRGVRSINTRLSEPTRDVFVSSTGTNLWYMRLWELTGHAAYDVYPKTKKALFWKGALHPVHHVHIPAERPRPFLRPTLREMRATIRERLRLAAGLT